MRKKLIATLVAVMIVTVSLVGLGWFVVSRALSPARSDDPLNDAQTTTLREGITLMNQHGLTEDAKLANTLLDQDIWRMASPKDQYLKAAEQADNTPYAYTLSEGKNPSAIVLAPRFFSQTTPFGRAALMIHEMGHYRAYVKTGKSDEYDGYKTEYDTAAKLGLSETDGLVYFGMLDGVAEYVVPRAPAYKKKPDVAAYIKQAGPG